MIEITPIKNFNATISVPGSKYIANRLLIICSLAEGTSILRNVPDNNDITNAIKALQEFGVNIDKKDGTLIINGTGGKLKLPKNEINVGDSGTLFRFIMSFAALAKGKTRINGSQRIQQRPISDLLKSLNDLGIKFNATKSHAPIVINGGNFIGGKTKIKGNISSQFISSLLITAPYAKYDVEIIVNDSLVSSEYVDMTIDLMRKFGLEVQRAKNIFKVKAGQKYKAIDFDIPSDWASANYFLAMAAIVPGAVRISNLDFKSKHPESGFFRLLEKMGCKTSINNKSIELIGHKKLKAIEADMSSMPDSVQTLAIVGLFADGITRISNISNLKYKESNRINDTATELKKLGAEVKVSDNEILIRKSNTNSAIIDSHNDHRMAMSFAIAGLKIPGIKIKSAECINKSFPDFWEKLNELYKNNGIVKCNHLKIRIAKTKKDLEQVFRIRKIVFIKEQKVSKNIERDEFDMIAKHVIAIYRNKPIGCARIRLINKKAKLERIAILKKYRSKGFGKILTEFLIEYCKNKNVKEIFMHSQYYLKDFYKKLGFKTRGKIFMEAGIKHIAMYKKS